MLVERGVFGRLQLVFGRLRLVDRFQHDGADAGLQRVPHAAVIDEMIGRSRDQRVFQRDAADSGVERDRHFFLRQTSVGLALRDTSSMLEKH